MSCLLASCTCTDMLIRREACTTANRSDVLDGRMYISEFQSACNRLSLSFTMPLMQMEIDDPDDDEDQSGNAHDAVVMWSQEDLVDGGGDALPNVSIPSSSAGSAGSAATSAALAHSTSSEPQQHGLQVLQVSSSESEMPRSSGRGRGRNNKGSSSRGRGTGRNPARTARTYSRSFSGFSFRSTSSTGSRDVTTKERGGDGDSLGDAQIEDDASVASQTQTQELLSVCAQQRRQLTLKQNRHKDMAAVVKRLKRKCQQLEKENKKLKLKQSKDQRDEQFAIQKLGRKHEGKASRYSRSSWFGVALRKCMTNVAACDFGLAAMSDISGSTVLRSEVRTAAGLLHTFHSFMAEALSFVMSCRGASGSDSVSAEEDSLEGIIIPAGIPEPLAQTEADEAVAAFARLSSGVSGARTQDPAQWSVVACGFRSDATNSNIWRRKKLSVAMCKVVWVHDFDMLQQGNFEEASTQRQCMTPMCIHKIICFGFVMLLVKQIHGHESGCVSAWPVAVSVHE